MKPAPLLPAPCRDMTCSTLPGAVDACCRGSKAGSSHGGSVKCRDKRGRIHAAKIASGFGSPGNCDNNCSWGQKPVRETECSSRWCGSTTTTTTTLSSPFEVSGGISQYQDLTVRYYQGNKSTMRYLAQYYIREDKNLLNNHWTLQYVPKKVPWLLSIYRLFSTRWSISSFTNFLILFFLDR